MSSTTKITNFNIKLKNHSVHNEIDIMDICNNYYFGTIADPISQIQQRYKENARFTTLRAATQIFNNSMANHIEYKVSEDANNLLQSFSQNGNVVNQDDDILLFLAKLHFISPHYKLDITSLTNENGQINVQYKIKTETVTILKDINIPVSANIAKKFQQQYEVFQYKKFGIEPSSIEAKQAVINYKHPSSLVLSGGGAKGILHGSLLNAINLHKIDKVYGNSAGALIATLISVGATADEVIKIIPDILFEPIRYHVQDFNKHKEKEKIKSVLPKAIQSTICSRIQDALKLSPNSFKLQNLYQQYINRDFIKSPITFIELQNLQNHIPTKELIVNGFMVHNHSEIMFSAKTTPNVSIISAALASASIPPIFSPEQFLASDLNIESSGKSKTIHVIDGGLFNKLTISHAVADLAPDQNTDSIVISYLEKKSDMQSRKNEYKSNFLKRIIEWIFGAKLFFAHNSTDYHMLHKHNCARFITLNAEYISGVSTTSFKRAKDKHNELLYQGYNQSIKQLYGNSSNSKLKPIDAETYKKRRIARVAFRLFFNNKAKTITKQNLYKTLNTILPKNQQQRLLTYLQSKYKIRPDILQKTLLQLIVHIAELEYKKLKKSNNLSETNILNTILPQLCELDKVLRFS